MTSDIKKEIAELLKKLEIITDKTVGKVIIDINCGGVREIQKHEKIA